MGKRGNLPSLSLRHGQDRRARRSPPPGRGDPGPRRFPGAQAETDCPARAAPRPPSPLSLHLLLPPSAGASAPGCSPAPGEGDPVPGSGGGVGAGGPQPTVFCFLIPDMLADWTLRGGRTLGARLPGAEVRELSARRRLLGPDSREGGIKRLPQTRRTSLDRPPPPTPPPAALLSTPSAPPAAPSPGDPAAAWAGPGPAPYSPERPRPGQAGVEFALPSPAPSQSAPASRPTPRLFQEGFQPPGRACGQGLRGATAARVPVTDPASAPGCALLLRPRVPAKPSRPTFSPSY